MSTETGDNVAASGEAQGLAAVGQRLAGVRREQQHTVAAVASGLHLSPDIVEALENGNESALPAMTFVRGYLKAYARFLGLDEKEVLAALPVDTGYQARPLKGVSMGPRPALRLPVGKWLTWLLVLAAILAAFMYGVPLVERLLDRTAEPAVDTNSLELPLGDPGPVTAAPALPSFATETVDAERTQDTVAAEQPVSEQVVASQAVAPAAPTPATTPPLAVKPEPSIDQAASTGPARVVLRFSEDSWVEMESHGRKLVVGTQRAGSERTVNAKPPIQILLGNAPGVTVIYRGEALDLEPYQRGKVARLVLED